MAIPTNKIELIRAISENYGKLKKQLLTIPPEMFLEKSLDGHAQFTKMSIHNLVSYLLGWGKIVIKWIETKENISNIEFPETGFKWNQLGDLAQKFYSDFSDNTYEDVINQLDNVHKRIVSEIDKMTNEDLYEKEWYGKWTMGRMIQFNTASPYANAKTRISKWRKTRNQ
ncbi:ClbS/DfsB family four-helix bundle protein [Flavobacterium cerinum]|uniref:ClbS/DfsB family four-helix bundle protein n=1 Tax=Flavobacterium cerinum TaxID=2502784 RepID=A0A3S3Q9N4_9FLAO|nr:ClbS/DfsB family four-helix bundle protein [Flavobacterium cerinum]RWX01387.1 ClbS/DfsB family four-helix bundle protein [Flavobacterium cerinum]